MSSTLLSLIEKNARYADALDRFDLAAWKALFTADAVYRVQARENFERGLPLALMYLDGHGMMADRITAIEKTLVFAPRTTRHVMGAPVFVHEPGKDVTSRTPFSVFQVVGHAPPEILAVGFYDDEWIESTGGLILKRRTAVYDNALIPNSLVYPL
jgi:3-phenylpropionate/cinnamic acid dioxygenase small subunit